MDKKTIVDLAWRALYTFYAIIIVGTILFGTGLLIHNLIFGMGK